MSRAPGEGGTLLAVAAGGVLGSLGRWAVSSVAGAPWGTVVVNLTGALTLGLLVAWLGAAQRHPLVRPFVAVGLLGGWTTYSTLALDGHALATDGLGGLLGYLALTLGLGVGAALAGLVIGERLWHTPPLVDDTAIDQEEL
ncbi:CrcB family protein [Janibacter terrae]|uniref:Fluoride-specific ion channel FluC n=1 Tax=Janibacter terrae TaxID=103817 RepID=A0ABZ2F9I5_9MICO